MAKNGTYIVVPLFLLLILTFVYQAFAFQGFGNATNGQWNNITWHYRFRLEINSSGVSRTNWPVEREINFTDLLPNTTFDVNSTRVYEYMGNGSQLREIASQLDLDPYFNASSNALGTLVFIMNGTTNANTTRIFYVYYDSIQTTAKTAPSYSRRINFTWVSREANVSTQLFNMTINTQKAENTSGITRVLDTQFENVILTTTQNSRSAEYVQYRNATSNLTFNLANNASFTLGPARLAIRQEGPEIGMGNSTNTSQGRIVKTYYIYNMSGPSVQGAFIKLKITFTNNASFSILRNSTAAGAVALDADRALSSGSIDSLDASSIDPYSYAWASGIGGELVGMINLNESVPGFNATNSTATGRIGINLNETNISSNGTIEHTTLIYFGVGGSDAVTEFLNIRNGFTHPIDIQQFEPEILRVDVRPAIAQSIYNRNETVLIRVNLSGGDPYNLTTFVNATIDNGTAAGDDTTIQLLDDGSNGDLVANDRLFSRNFGLDNNSNITEWTVNFTAFDPALNFLNSSIGRFNITNILNVTVVIQNPQGLVNRIVFANVTVTNFRKDIFYSDASVACIFGSTPIVNITSAGNGNYTVNFSAPIFQSSFVLLCNATRVTNFGNNSASFITEIDNTELNLSSRPLMTNISNISAIQGSTFSVRINATNNGNGTASTTNLILTTPGGWSYTPGQQSCGDINIASSCERQFDITAPAGTLPGLYTFNITANWSNPGGSTTFNTSSGNVTVYPYAIIDITTANVTEDVGDGVLTIIGNFSFTSLGNVPAANLTITCMSGICQNFTANFTPPNISFLPINASVNISVNVTVPFAFPPGTYNGTINVTAANNSDTILFFVTLRANTNVTSVFLMENYSAAGVTQFTSDTFTLPTNTTNVQNSSARFVNLTLTTPSGWSFIPQTRACGNLTRSASCVTNFTVTIPNSTAAGDYTINMTTNWTNLDGSTNTSNSVFLVIVTLNPFVNLSVSNITANATDGLRTPIGNFSVLSIGNANATNINISCVSGVVCNNFTVGFEPSNISFLATGTNQTVKVNVTVPSLFPAGIYSGTANITTSNTQQLALFINVPVNRTWTVTPLTCQRSQNPQVGTVCSVLVTNLGNIRINFTLSPSSVNFTSVNETNFSVPIQGNHTFSILYNVTGQIQIYYNSTYTLNTSDGPSQPQEQQINATLIPYTPPIINITFNQTPIEQNATIRINATIEDRSNTNMTFVRVNVTMPNGTTFTSDMTLVDVSGNRSNWTFVYPNFTAGHADTAQGQYNVTVFGEDQIGNQGNNNLSFVVHTKLGVTAITLSSSYFQGDTASLFYIARDVFGSPLQNVNTTLKVLDSTGNVTHLESKVTNSEGTISPLPSFLIASDSPVGNFTLLSNSSFYDSLTNLNVTRFTNYSFSVAQKTVSVSGLFAQLETAVVWYPNNVMRFSLLIYNGEGQPVDPTSINLTVFDPAGNLYFTITNLSQLTKQQTGLYQYNFAMPITTATGMYLAVFEARQGSFQTLNAKAFRVATGGPYDLRILLPVAEASQGGTLNFNLVIENKGEVSQDVFLDYSVVSTSNQTYYTASEAVFTPANSNQTFTRTAQIFSTQPLGTYVLNVRMRFDNVQPAVVANASFIVLSGTSGPPPVIIVNPPAGGTFRGPPFTGAVTEIQERPIQRGIVITRYNDNVSLSRGFTRIEHVTITNIGNTLARNITLVVLGIPANWYTVTPLTYDSLSSQNSTVFLIEYNIPKDAEVGDRVASLLVSAGTLSDQRPVKLSIFRNLDELLRFEIYDFERDYNDLLVEIRLAEKQGVDVRNLDTLTDSIAGKISDAKVALDIPDYDRVYDDIDTGRNFIDKTYDLLATMRTKETNVDTFPLWILFVVLAIIIIAVVVLYILYKKKKFVIPHPKIGIHLPMPSLPKLTVGPKPLTPETKMEKDKLIRMMNVLENERKEGLITENAYQEMKKNLQERLAKMNG